MASMCTSMRLSAHFGRWLEVGHRGQKVRRWQVAAGLIYGQVKKSYRRRKLVRVTHMMRLGTQTDLKIARPRDGLLWAIEHRLYRAGESDCPPWSGSFGASHLVHGEACPTPPSSSRVVASLLSCCASPCIAPGDTWAAARARWQAGGATLPATYPSHGSRENQPTVVNAGSPVLSLATSAMLHHLSVNGASRHPVKWR